MPLHVFYGTVYLEILNMSQNQLQDLPLHVFYGTVYLEFLNMSQNQLQALPLHVFYGTVYLEFLNMSQNKLPDLPRHVFYGTVYLEILHMSQFASLMDMNSLFGLTSQPVAPLSSTFCAALTHAHAEAMSPLVDLPLRIKKF